MKRKILKIRKKKKPQWQENLIHKDLYKKLTFIFFLFLVLQLYPGAKNFFTSAPDVKGVSVYYQNQQDINVKEKDNTFDKIKYDFSLQTKVTDFPVIFHGARGGKKIALTFDADMTSGMIANLRSGRVKSYVDTRIIDYLQKTQTKATLFMTGLWIEAYMDLAKNLGQDPLFQLANHSYTHSSFHGTCYGLKEIPDSQDREEIEKTQKLLGEIGVQKNKFFRFPGGCYSIKDVNIVSSLGLKVVHWDANGNDGFNPQEKNIENSILKSVQNGSIILLHINGPPNAPKTFDALQNIIPHLKSQGYEFVKVSELLGL